MATNPMTDSEGGGALGQRIDEVSSEITEIMKAERRIQGPIDKTALFEEYLKLIPKYIRAVYSVIWRDEIDVETDPIYSKIREYEMEFYELELDDVTIMQDVFEDAPISIITASWNAGERNMVPPITSMELYKMKDEKAKDRMNLQLSKIAAKINRLLAPEIDLHRNLAITTTSQETFEARYFNDETGR